ncbi:MAG: putative porin [Bacteroidota bacterium]
MQGIRLIILMLLGLTSASAFAQFPTNPGQQGSDFGSNRFQNQLGQQGSPFPNDSLGTDSAQLKIKRDTRIIDRQRLFTHLPNVGQRVGFDIATLHYWDKELEFADGFVQSLGQVGKPHQVLYHGFDEGFYVRDSWWNPVFNRYNRYFLNPQTEIPFFDTRTPYVNVDFAQGSDQLNLLDVTLSQNIRPTWNVTAFFGRRQAEGAYREFVTDHYNLFLNSNFHTRNRRYHAFTNFFFSELSDQIHGGSPRAQSDLIVEEDGVLIDDVNLYNRSFFKGISAPILSDATRKDYIKGIHLDQYYHLLGAPQDTNASVQKLTLRNLIHYEYGYQRFKDPSITTSSLDNNIIPVYPTLLIDTAFSAQMDESFNTDQIKVAGEASYTLAFGKAFRLNVNGGINYQRLLVTNDSNRFALNMTEQNVRSELRFPGVSLRANLQQQISDQFSAARTVSFDGRMWPGVYLNFKKNTLVDSLESARKPRELEEVDQVAKWEGQSPLRLEASYLLRDLNPSIFQTNYISARTNAYLANPDLVNQTLTDIRLGASLRQRAPIRGKDTLLSNYVSLHAFTSRVNRFIYYNSELEPLQAASGENVSWVGLETRFRLRMLKHVYLESNLTFQQGSTNSDDEILGLYVRSVPQLYGKTSLYYDVRWRGFARGFRLGVDVHGHTSYIGQTLDPLSNEFFQTNYQMFPYARADVYLSLNLRGVGVFFKYMHVNENLIVTGYYTTPAYPMLERVLTLGVNWSFFD